MYNPNNMSVQAQTAVAQRGTPATLNLDDIFGDVMFTPDGDTVFLSEQQDTTGVLNSGEGDNVHISAAKQQGNQFVPVPIGGGLATTNLADNTKPALVMGQSANPFVPTSQEIPFKKTPQERHHLQFAAPKRKRSSRSDRKMSEQQKTDRRYVGSYCLWPAASLFALWGCLSYLVSCLRLLSLSFGVSKLWTWALEEDRHQSLPKIRQSLANYCPFSFTIPDVQGTEP
jgi:hypothetical protein